MTNIFKRILRKVHYPQYSIGIDFGTTITRISYVNNYENVYHQPRIKPIRSAVCPLKLSNEKRKYDWKVGDDALELGDCFTKFKLNMGEMKELKIVSNSGTIEFRPEILAARIIWLLRKEIKNSDYGTWAIKDVTITVPAEWNFIQREATIKAAKIAGFSNVNVIEEPIAAFIALAAFYKDKVLRRNKNFVVFDCGGGTLDITVINHPSDEILPRVIGRSMDMEMVAGEHIDEMLAKKIVGETRWEELNPREKKKLIQIARTLKEGLNPPEPNSIPSGIVTWPTKLNFERLHFNSNELKLELETLEEIVNPVIEKAKKKIKDALKKANLKEDEINKVILVGGSCYLRAIQNCITDFFNPKKIGEEILLEEPERIVAFGAALQQSYIDRGIKRFSPTLALDTYFRYEKENNDGSMIEIDYLLGKAGDTLPIISPKFSDTLSIPERKESIHWKVYQERNDVENLPEVVEQIKFEKYRPDFYNQLRLDYKIDLNGNLSVWRPRLIGNPRNKPMTGSERQYDWNKKDSIQLAFEFGICDDVSETDKDLVD